jgi:nucleoside-diphosphate-sugar epimerase
MEAFNVGSDRVVSILELANIVADALGSPGNVRVAQRAIPGAEVQQYVPSIRKAEIELGLKCKMSLEEAIRRTASWHGYMASQS